MRLGVREKLPKLNKYSPLVLYKVDNPHTQCKVANGGVVGGQHDAEGRLQALMSVRSQPESRL